MFRNKTTTRLLLLLVALGLLVLDYVVAKALLRDGGATEALQHDQELRALNELRKQDAMQVKRHLQLCSLAEEISQLNYDAGVAMGGYSITKDAMFSSRFEKIEEVLPKKVQELSGLVSTIPDEKDIVQSIGEQTTAMLRINKQAQALIDDPKINQEQFKGRHVYKDIRGISDRLRQQIHALRDKDLTRMDDVIHKQPAGSVHKKPESRILALYCFAGVNAIFGCLIGRFFWCRR